MPYYQNSQATNTKLVLGNYKIEVATTTVGSAYINLGSGMLTAAGYNIEKYDVQAGNAPDPVEGISRETFTAAYDLIEYDGSSLTHIQGGAVTETNSTTSIMVGGGNTVITPRIYRFTNTSIYSGATKETVITMHNATMDTGIQFTVKSDNDTDPIQVMPISITGKPDTTLTVGEQLFKIEKTI